jgi:methyltransferase (TIGR00027 family)
MKSVRAPVMAAAALLCAVQPALAVRPGEVSGTAGTVCLYRMIAAEHPDAKLRNSDGLAAKLCRRPLNFGDDYATARRLIDNSGEMYAAYFYVNARTHYIDAALHRAAADGIKQVVVLGAGFDSRAYRFRGRYPELMFFEVDLPATIEEKKRRVAGIFGAAPDYVRYAPIDFDSQGLGDVLLPLGYDPKQRAFFIWEGVTPYVGEAGNRATMRWISANSASGSRLVYDYLLRQVVQGKYDGLYAIGSTAAFVAARGEPYVTGWTPRGAAAFAKKQGLKVLEDLGPRELTRRHLTGSDGRPDGKMVEGHRLIEATVP